ncbi:GNAT family N-acetyltransferase [Collimonas sp. NPDC087041]|uniref:GNAT family N-acetyltransferase n=1 Tax=Collimonas sp. NPDC087041 TaxID=3363960 RepID=UPI003830C95F
MPSFTPTILSTPRLILRPLQESDAAALFTIFSDPEVMRYWSTVPWASIDVAHELIANDIVAHQEGRYLRLGMQTQADNHLIGMCSLFAIDSQNLRADLGYGMGSTHWGNGYMHEALTTFVEHAFEAFNLRRLEADIDPRNAASAKTLERLGFVKEGHLRERWLVDGVVSDTDLYGLLRRDWLAR